MKPSERKAKSGEETKDSNRERTSGTRRRGKELEDAILAAAWEELRETGYASATMENIAVRAGTNKTSVYRRWPSKAKVMAASIAKHIERPKIEAPGTGDLRQDLFALMQSFARPIEQLGAETIHGLLAEYYEDGVLIRIERPKSDNKLDAAIREILRQAEERGDVKRISELSPRVLALPLTLIQHELLIQREPLSDEKIAEIIDQIFLPLVRK